MFSYTPMKKLAGIRLEADYFTFQVLNHTIHEVADRFAHENTDDADVLMGLAYDARKAMEQAREVLQPLEEYEEVGIRYGVKIIWPTLLLQARMLREAMSIGPSNARFQSITYDLEAVIEDAIKDQFGAKAEQVLFHWKRLSTLTPGTADKITPLGAMFSAWSAKERSVRMIALLEAFNPMYASWVDIIKKQGQPVIEPDEMAAWARREWVDPETGKP